jgi:magnesium transporter
MLMEAEPRAQRQIIANLRQGRARMILSEMSVPQMADLFSVLPHDDMVELIGMLPPDRADRVRAVMSEHEAVAQMMMSADYVSAAREDTVGQVLDGLRHSHRDHSAVSYAYVLSPEKTLLGVADLREMVVTDDEKTLGEIMDSPVVSADAEDSRDDLGELFAKYHFRMLPVVDKDDHLLGVVHYKDIMKGLVTRAQT